MIKTADSQADSQAAKAKLGARTTAIEALRGVDLTGKQAVVTGECRQLRRPCPQLCPPCCRGRSSVTSTLPNSSLTTCLALFGQLAVDSQGAASHHLQSPVL